MMLRIVRPVSSLGRRASLAAWGLAIGLLATSLPGRARAEGPPPNPAAGLVRVLILTGEGGHAWRETTPVLRRLLADTGRFDVKVCESPNGISERTLAGFDLLVDNGAGLAPGSDTEKAVASFVASGKGLVVAHGAIRGSAPPAFWPVQNGSPSLPPVHFLDVTISMPDHPMTRGMKGFRTADSLPPGLLPKPDSATIATAVAAKGGSDSEVGPAIVVSGHGQGRVVYIALGHNPSAMHEPAFIAAFARGAEWAATGSVTQPAEPAPTRPAPGAVRGLLITGGHDHEATFYSLFEGYDDLDWLAVDASTTAFRKDLRGKYDVVIMYDFTRDMDDECKKNLRDFVESGNGVVVLHHALLNYQKWPWWYEEVVGGRYRLSSEGKTPSSSVKDAQEIFVTPQGDHPVTSGIEPFHIKDEAYKRMWISDRVHPLLTTDNPTSDSTLAWVGPHEKSRVVAIQLGHGHTAFAHPSYRALVHNAIRWAAGKSK
jgi:type 1 glutamine amidotransferase